MDHFEVTGRQLAAARTLVGKTQSEIAKAANISVPTLKRMEASPKSVSGIPNNVMAVIRVLEAEGIRFTKPGDVCQGTGISLVNVPNVPDGPLDANNNYAEARLAA